ncbi:hypothetical protein [Sporolactobacillus nakayamae]|uniref:Uncharacterized protein n=1 Tax=Sporolactobacillus nakayamae TaxID=269670 RepID=A0A1I2PBI1_9BACL|nr:hypothetical protein [Sporolactobacillus nakayamae]SFG10811.1 hypothetical protein SAMN02982927_00702 [Sporolactobacillus nakayamae]
MTDIVQLNYPNGAPFYPKTHAQAVDGLAEEIGEAVGDLNYPVTKVNGKTGNVELNAADVGTYTDDEIDDKLTGKVSKVDGKGLSKNDYTDDDKAEVGKITDKQDAILVSPGGSKFTLVVDDDGNLSTEPYEEGAGE